MYKNKKKDKMLEQIVEVVDVAILIKTLRNIKNYQIKHIVEVILDCAMSKILLQEAN